MANTTNLNLVKPAGTDHALVSDINGNMDLIDAFAGSTNTAIANIKGHDDLGSISSLSDLVSALNTKISSMDVSTSLPIRFNCTTAFAPFAAVNYYGVMRKGGSSGNYASVLFENINGASGAVVKATKNTTWNFEELITSKKISNSSVSGIKNNNTATLYDLGIVSGGENCLLTLISGVGVANSSSCYVVRVSSGGACFVTPIGEGSDTRAPRVSATGVLTTNGLTTAIEILYMKQTYA